MSSFVKTDAGRKSAVNMQALQRVARPEDIGLVIAFLASDEARWITPPRPPSRLVEDQASPHPFALQRHPKKAQHRGCI